MDFFDKLGDTAKTVGDRASAAAKDLGNKASDALELARLNAKLNSEKARLGNYYAVLGEKIYRESLLPEAAQASCASLIEALEKEQKVIETIEEEIARLHKDASNLRGVCPDCGYVNEISSQFCRKCGHKLEV